MAASSKPRAVTVVLVGVVTLLLIAGAVPLIDADASARQSQPETDNTVTRIVVAENGSARWTIRIRTRLGTDERVEEYRVFQDRFRANRSQYLGTFRNRMTGVVANAANATGREMRAANFAASTRIQEVPRRWGVVTYEFTWTNFAARNGDRLVVDNIEGGFFIADNDTLKIAAPTDYRIESVEPSPDAQADGVATWQGREDFADGHPRVVFGPAPAAGTLGDGNGLGGMVLVGAIAALALVGAVLAVGYWRRERDRGGPSSAADSPVDRGTDEPSGTGSSGSGASGTATASRDESASDRPVMTDEERVLALLEANDGRMRQAAIADELDWSASKTSRTLGSMAEEGTVEKLQLGRENLVDLPDEDG